MKTFFLLMLVFITQFVVDASPFYYFKGTRIELNLCKKAINIGFYNYVSMERRKEIFAKYNELDQRVFKEGVTPTILLSFSLVSLVNEMDETSINQLLERLLLEKEIRFCYPTYLKNNSSIPFGFVNQVIVKLKNKSNDYGLLTETAREFGYDTIEKYMFDNDIYILSQSKSGIDPLSLSKQLTESGSFEYAEPNFWFMVESNSYPNPNNNTHYGDAWHINNTNTWGNSNNVNVLGAWDYTTGCPNIKIAISDDGVQLTHPDLTANLSTGFDALTAMNTSFYTYGIPYNPSTGGTLGGIDDPVNEIHGTCVAGIVSSENNNIGSIGVANTCKIQPIRSLISTQYWYYTSSTSNLQIALSSMISATFDWCRLTGLSDVVNCSWMGDLSQGIPVISLVDNSINNLISLGRNGKGTNIIFAAGNSIIDNSILYPNNKENVICVGSIAHCDNKRQQLVNCDFRNAGGGKYNSNYGYMLDLVAPGTNIPTTDNTGIDGYSHSTASYLVNYFQYSNVSNYVRFDGTSSAAPICSGIMGLILSTNNTLTQVEAREVLESSATKYTDYNYNFNTNYPNGRWHEEMGYGIVNAGRAVEFAYDTYYYQNQTLNNLTENHIRIFAGKKVKPTQTQGNVIVPNTSTSTLTAKRIIHLKEGFKATAGPGTKFLAKIDNTILPATSNTCPSEVSEVIVPQDNGNNNSTNNERTSQKLDIKLNVFPSPAYTLINVKIDGEVFKAEYLLTITDILGRIVLSKKILDIKNMEQINISGFTEGTYFLNIKNSQTEMNTKFLKLN